MVNIGGHRIGFIGLSEIFEIIKEMNLSDEIEIQNKLIEQAKVKNYIP